MRFSKFIFTVTLLLYTSIATATIIKVPQYQSTIQAGIDSASVGDTVLVDTGRYIENINFNGKNIVVSSLFLTTGDPSYISQTVIDGDSSGSVVTFKKGEDSSAVLNGFAITNGLISDADGGGIYCYDSSPSLMNLIVSRNIARGWDIGGGNGGGISCYNSSPILKNVTVTQNTSSFGGGGIFCWDANPRLENVTISDNLTSGTGFMGYGGGGGILCVNSNPSLVNVTISGNTAYWYGGGISLWNSNTTLANVKIRENSANRYGGGVYFHESSPSFDSEQRCNIYSNHALSGMDLSADDSPTIYIVVDTFTVISPTDYYVSPRDSFVFDILHAKVEQVDSDLYISPDGDNTNTGQTISESLRSISFALSILSADSLNPHTIYVTEGVYSHSTSGDDFPLNMVSYISLIGESETGVILDSEGRSGVMYFDRTQGITVENLTITGGSSGQGSGIYCKESNPNFAHVTITGNGITRGGYGGGIHCSNSRPTLENVTIIGNRAGRGGGIFSRNSNPSLINMIVSGNTASSKGGGIYCEGTYSPSLSNVLVTGNNASRGGGLYFRSSKPIFDTENRSNIFLNRASRGNDLFAYDSPTIEVVVDTFTVMTPTNFHAFPIESFSFDIYHAKIEPVAADLYVGTEGDDSHTGLSSSETLRTITTALSKVIADSLNPHNIYLAEGIYSNSKTGEHFPLYMIDYVSLIGKSKDRVVLDAEGRGDVLVFDQDQGIAIENMTITGGSAHGVYCYESNPLIRNVTVSGNQKGGIACDKSDPIFENVTITDNNGSGLSCSSSNPILVDVSINGNSVSQSGGGIYCYASSPMLVNVKVSGNTSNRSGGGITLAWDSNPTLMNVEVNDNTAYNGGGGIYCVANSNPIIIHVLLSSNKANLGAGIYCYKSSPMLINVTSSGNISSLDGGSIYATKNSNPVLINSILWNNSPDEIYFFQNSSPNSITSAYSNIEGGRDGIVVNNNGTVNWLDGNIDADPLFVNLEIGNFKLRKGSPCIDAGTAFLVWKGDTLVNLPDTAYGGDAPDMGAFESPYSVDIVSEDAIPMEFALYQNYPNPFNPSTTIEFSIPQSGLVTLTVFDVLGRKVDTILSDYRDIGHHKLQWNASNVPSGIYFIRMESRDPSLSSPEGWAPLVAGQARQGFSQVRKGMVLK